MYMTNLITPLKTLSRSALRAFRISPTCPAAVLGSVATETGVASDSSSGAEEAERVVSVALGDDARSDCGGGRGADGGKDRGQRY